MSPASPDDNAPFPLRRLAASGTEAVLVLIIWAGILSVPVGSVLVGACCSQADAPPPGPIVASMIASALPWVVLTLPLFGLCRRLRPGDIGWLKAVAGHVGVALVLPVVAESAGNALLQGAHATLLPDTDPLRAAPVNPLAIVGTLTFLSGLPAYLVVILIGMGRDAYLRYRTRRAQAERLERETERLRAQLTSARLDALRMQINPHFLFNTLHTISTMAPVDPDGTQAGIARLSEMLRYALSTSDRHEVPLSEEVRFLESYLAIQKLRLEERVDVTLDVAPEVRQALVPTLLLQPLAENALTHGFDGAEGTIRLRIGAHRHGDRLEIVVADSGCGLDDPARVLGDAVTDSEPAAGGGGRGLRNLRKRLRGLHGDEADLLFAPSEAGGLRVTVRLPYREHAPESLRLSAVEVGEEAAAT